MPSLVNSAMSRLQPAVSAIGSATLDDPPKTWNCVRKKVDEILDVKSSHQVDNPRRECRIGFLQQRKLLRVSETKFKIRS